MNVYQFIQGWRSLWIGKVIIPLHLFHSPFLLTLRISENHRIFEVGTDLWSPFGATSPAQGQPPRASCPERFWMSLGMKTPQLLWEACTSAESLSQEKFSEGHSCVAGCAHCLWLCHWTQLKSSVLSSALSPEVLLHINKIPLFLLLPRLKGPCSLSLSSLMRCWRPLITFDALFWTMSMCVSHWGAQTWTLHPREGPHLCWAEGKDHLPQTAGSALSNAAQDGFKDTLLAHSQRGVQLQGLFCKAASHQDGPQHLLLPQAVPSQVKDLTLPLVELHEVISWDRK